MKWKAKIAIILSIFLVGYLGYLVLNTKSPPNNEMFFDYGSQIPQSYPVLGVDVSHYQGEINWEQVSSMNVKNDTIQFAYIKATEGITIVDDKSKYNIENARANDVDAGFYHFFRPSVSAIKQADFFIDNSYNYNYNLRPALDVEVNEEFASDVLVDSILTFLNRVEDRTDERPIIYTYANFYDTYLNVDELSDEIFWMAQYNVDCPLMAKDNVVAWQFSESGTVSGINEAVDLNIAKEEFLELVRLKN
jgi:lysozyme